MKHINSREKGGGQRTEREGGEMGKQRMNWATGRLNEKRRK